MQIITSKSNSKIKFVTYLKTTKGRKENHMFVCEGSKALEMALRTDLVTDVFSLKPIGNLPDTINQYLVNEEVLNKLSSSLNPEGVVFVSEIKEKPFDNNFNKIIYLDDIQDPGNMGTIIRTALAFGFDAVVASENSVDFYNEKVIAASKGSIFMMPLFVGDIDNFSKDKKVVVSALEDNAIELESVKPVDKIVLVLGNEAHGVNKKILEKADIVTKIAIKNIDSLNVAVAGAILMHHFQ